jgi:hypothetical protein
MELSLAVVYRILTNEVSVRRRLPKTSKLGGFTVFGLKSSFDLQTSIVW